MVFSSPEFLELFLPITLIVYYVFPRKARNAVLLICSLVFYGWEEPVYVLVMIGTLIFDWLFGFFCSRSKEKNNGKARMWLVISCVFNLSILFFFKYFNFIFSAVTSLIGIDTSFKINVELPIGISFYTFQAMSYVIDVYRGDASHAKNPVVFGTYVTLFPQLVAGPIVRYKDVEKMLTSRRESLSFLTSGIHRFVIGLGKKVILADTAGRLWNVCREIPDEQRGTAVAVLGIILFTFQLYFDFSGYSDMAIGLGRMFGFEFCENFNYPYMADSLTDFWRRWHISLSTWFRDYLYIPLGGNRVKVPRHIFNMCVVWLLTGLWHGADWGFVIWGVYYAVMLVCEKYVWGKVLDKAPYFVRRVYSLLFIVIGWFIFITPDLGSVSGYLSSFLNGAGSNDVFVISGMVMLIAVFAVACTPYPAKLAAAVKEKNALIGTVLDVVFVLAVLILSFALLVSSDYSPFLYTRF